MFKKRKRLIRVLTYQNFNGWVDKNKNDIEIDFVEYSGDNTIFVYYYVLNKKK